MLAFHVCFFSICICIVGPLFIGTSEYNKLTKQNWNKRSNLSRRFNGKKQLRQRNQERRFQAAVRQTMLLHQTQVQMPQRLQQAEVHAH